MPKVYSTGDTLPASDLNGIVKVAGGYAASATGNDSYAVTLTPAPGSYAAGDVYYFKADVANTGAASLNVNSLGAKTIKKMKSGVLADLETGDIAAGQIVAVAYDGTYLLMLTQWGELPVQSFVGAVTTSSRSAAGTANTDTTFTASFKARTISLYFKIAGKNGTTANCGSAGIAYFNGTTLTSIFWFYQNPSSVIPSNITPSTITMDSNSVTVGDNTGGNGAKVTVTINSVSATDFVVRAAFDCIGDGSTASATFYPIAHS